MQNIKNLILMSYEIKFKNKKQSHTLNKIHHTTFSKKKKNHTTKIITRSILLKIFKKNDYSYY